MRARLAEVAKDPKTIEALEVAIVTLRESAKQEAARASASRRRALKRFH